MMQSIKTVSHNLDCKTVTFTTQHVHQSQPTSNPELPSTEKNIERVRTFACPNTMTYYKLESMNANFTTFSF